MSHRMVLTVSDDHYKMLEQVRKERGLQNIQKAVSSILEDVYSTKQAIMTGAQFSKKAFKQAAEA